MITKAEAYSPQHDFLAPAFEDRRRLLRHVHIRAELGARIDDAELLFFL